MRCSSTRTPVTSLRSSTERQADEVEWLGEGGIALGVEDDAGYKAGRVELDPGDMVVFYTDGVTEAPRLGRPFGQGRLTDLVTEYGVGYSGRARAGDQARCRVVDAPRTSCATTSRCSSSRSLPTMHSAKPCARSLFPNEPGARSRRSAASSPRSSPTSARRSRSRPRSCWRWERPPGTRTAMDEGSRGAARSGSAASSTVRPSRSMVADDGPGFDVGEVEARDAPDPFAQGGRGLFLMRELMDEVEVETSPEGTTVRMRRNLG